MRSLALADCIRAGGLSIMIGYSYLPIIFRQVRSSTEENKK